MRIICKFRSSRPSHGRFEFQVYIYIKPFTLSSFVDFSNLKQLKESYDSRLTDLLTQISRLRD